MASGVATKNVRGMYTSVNTCGFGQLFSSAGAVFGVSANLILTPEFGCEVSCCSHSLVTFGVVAGLCKALCVSCAYTLVAAAFWSSQPKSSLPKMARGKKVEVPKPEKGVKNISNLRRSSDTRQERQQMNIRLGLDYVDMISSVLSYWSSNENEELTFLGHTPLPEHLRTNISLCRFILQAGIEALYADASNKKRIDELALWLDGFLETCDPIDCDWDDVKKSASTWVKQNWGPSEHDGLFELIYPLAMEKAQALADIDPEKDELFQRKMHLDGSINIR